MTEVIRSDAPRRSSTAALALAGLIVGILWFTILVVVVALQVLSGVTDPSVNVLVGVYSAMIFVLLAVALDIYRKYYMPDELVHKVRRTKIVPPRVFR